MSSFIKHLLGRLAQFNRWKDVRQYAVVGIAPLIFIGTIFIWQGAQHSNPEDSVLSVTAAQEKEVDPAPSESLRVKQNTITIDISGAVNAPGIKEIADGSRVNDAIWSALGYSLDADRQYIAQVLNLAQPLRDGDKIYIPTYVEVNNSLPDPPILLNKINQPMNVLSGEQNENNVIIKGQEGVEGDVKININTASQSQLEDLPGIGAVNAKNIIAGRPYVATQDLCTKKIITNATTCAKIQDLISL